MRGQALLNYSSAFVAAGLAALLRSLLTPLIGETDIPFITFFPAVLFVAWYAGFRAATACILLSALAADYFFMAPVRSFSIPDTSDRINLLIFVLVGWGMALLAESQRRAIQRLKSAERAEHEARSQYETTLASIGDAVIATDASGRITFTNKVARDLIRRPESELLGRKLDDVFRIVNEHTRATVESPVAKVLREGSIVGLANHTVLIAGDGSEVPIDDSAAPIRDAEGNLHGTVLVFRDVTVRRRAEESSRLLASIVENSDDAIVSKTPHGVITSWNKAAELMFGYTAEEAIGQPISIIADPAHNEMPEILANIREGKQTLHYETIRKAKDGRKLNISLTVSPVRNSEGQIVGASKIARDITERIRAAEQLAQANREIQLTRDNLRITLSSIGDAVVSTDAHGRIVFANPVAQALMGWSEQELTGRHLDEAFRIVNEFTREPVESPVAKVLREGTIVGLANHTILLARDGTEIPIDDSAAPIRDEFGNIQGTVMVFRAIAERRKIERDLRETAGRLQLALEAGRMGAWDWNLASGKVTWSAGLEAIHGLAPGSFAGTFEGFLSDIHPGDLDRVTQAIRQAVDSKAEHDIEYRILLPAGEIRWIRGTGRVILDAAGNVTGMAGICMDITERKQSENALRESEERFRNLADNAPVLIWVSGLDKKCTWFNRPWLEFTGRTLEQEIGDGWAEGVHPDDMQRCVETYASSFDRRESFVMEYRLRRHDGQWRWILDHGIPLQAGGHFIGYIGSCLDITDRRNIEQSHRELAEIVESSDDAIIGETLTGTVLSWNRGAERVYGYPEHEAIGQPLAALIAPPDRRHEIPEMLARIRQGERIEQFQTKRRRRDGALIDVSLTISPVKDANGRVISAATVARDITEQVKAADRLAATNEDLERFAFVASHDLQEPLRMITSYTQLLLSEFPGELEGDFARYAGFIVDGTRRMRELVADLLAYTEIRGQTGEFTEVVDLNQTLDQVRLNLQESIQSSGATITSDSLPVIEGLGAHFVTLFQNLIGNSIKYRGEQAPLINVGFREAGGELCFALSDNGMGIEPEYHDQIFVAFKRLHGRRIPGTGIGLAICQRVVERYGGRIWVASEPGKGATFHFTLPATAAHASKGRSGHA